MMNGDRPSPVGNFISFPCVRKIPLLAGTIPLELGNLVELESLWLFNNQLTGDLCIDGGHPSNWFYG